MAAILLASSLAWAQEGANLAKKLYDSATHDVFRADRASPKETGEDLCWRAAYSGHYFADGYRAVGEAAFLDYGLKFYDALADAMDTGPDGYKGFIGPYDYEPTVWCDVHVGDALVLHGMLDLAEVILKDPALKAKYGERVAKYVALAEKDLFEKWDARGTWREDGPYGAYIFYNKYCKPNDLKNWVTLPGMRNSSNSLPYNQANELAVVYLRLHRITGNKKYHDRAEKLFASMKARLQFFDDHYCWNYWEPMGPWDVDLEKGDTRHWVATHPYSNYQAGEVAQIVEAYQAGVVFDETDIRRLVNTNLKVMWDGNLKAPQFRNSNATVSGVRPSAPSKDHPNVAGCLWGALAVFDATVRELEGAGLKQGDDPGDTIARAYFKNVTSKEPPSFKRKYASETADVFEFPFSECKGLIAASVMPSRIKQGTKSVVFCKTHASGDLEIAVYSADGKTKKAVLYQGALKGDTDAGSMAIRQWDGTDPAGKEQFEGPCRVRWTFPGGYREFPVVISK
jgi:hypothetical protein